MVSSSSQKRIRIYNSGGALPMCAEASRQMLSSIFTDQTNPSPQTNPSYDISFIDALEMRSTTSRWQDDTALIVFSGGGVTGFKHALKDQGLQALKNYVADGGLYLGLCAGAYFGATDIDFTGHDWQTNKPYKRGGEGEGLGFFNGLAKGSVSEIAPLYDGTSATCCATHVTLDGLAPTRALPPRASVFYGGGPEFILRKDAKLTDSHIISRYALDDNITKIAGLSCPVGDKGGHAYLLSWHADLSASFIKSSNRHSFQDPGCNRGSIADHMDDYNNNENKAAKWLGRHLKQRL